MWAENFPRRPAWALAALAAGLVFFCGGNPARADGPPVQKPPPGLSQTMARMKVRAEEVIWRAGQGEPTPAAFRQAALEIFRVMRPVFGPANAWLFNERARKVEELARALGLGPEALAWIDEAVYERACQDLEMVRLAVKELGYPTEVSPADRSALRWTAAPGFALTLREASGRADRPPAGSAPLTGPGPGEQVPALTLYLFPPLPGRALGPLPRGEPPGEPVFFTGGLLGYTLPAFPAREGPAKELLDKLLDKMHAGGLIFRPPAEALDRLARAAGGNLASGGIRHGLLWAVAAGPPPAGLEGLRGCAVLWQAQAGPQPGVQLLFPQ